MDLNQRANSIFACHSHPYRRKTVTIVTEMSEPITIDELGQEIVNRSDTVVSGDPDSDSDPVETIRIELYHRHLPKLADADLMEYDPDANPVSTTPATTHLTALVQIAYSIAEAM